jgi:hypothetical protein
LTIKHRNQRRYSERYFGKGQFTLYNSLLSEGSKAFASATAATTGRHWDRNRIPRTEMTAAQLGVVEGRPRKAELPITHLAEFKGILQVDGYGGHRSLAERGDVQLAFCWAHGASPITGI